MKTIALFGGSGRTGIQIVKQALEQGHRLRILVRNPSTFPISHTNIELVKGDATQFADVLAAMKGAEAVISVLGHTKSSPAKFQTKAMLHIVKAMQEIGRNRILVLTGSGVVFQDEKESFGSRLVSWTIRTIAPARFDDGMNQSNVLVESGLDYTLVRAPMLTNGKCTQKYRCGNVKIGMFNSISRADIAHFIIKELLENQFLQQSPFISY